ncbi:MAG: disulfide bond formation protein B [Pirellulaceae bacterium]
MKVQDDNGRWRRLWAMAALLFALIGVAGSLYLSLGLGLRACPLCFYQRSFMMGTLAVLVVGLAADPTRTGLYCLLSLPLALAGWGVAAFHEYLVLTGVLECPIGLLGIGTSPAQSLVVFTLVTAALLAGAWPIRSDGKRRAAVSIGSIIVGVLMAWGSIASSPPMPPAPTTPYDLDRQPLDMCRPPYPGQQ